MIRPIAAATLALLAIPALADDHRTPSPEGARVYIIAPADGATVSSPVTVLFGAAGIGVAPAGVEKPGTGHHHLLIDAAVTDELLAEALPADEHHVHFGGGQTQTTIELPPGTHTLRLVMADWQHIPHDPPLVSDRVTITVTD